MALSRVNLLTSPFFVSSIKEDLYAADRKDEKGNYGSDSGG